MPGTAEIRVFRVSHREFSVTCGLCGPLGVPRTQDEALRAGREHLERQHGGGMIGVGYGPLRPWHPLPADLEARLDDLAAWMADPNTTRPGVDRLQQICAEILRAAGRDPVRPVGHRPEGSPSPPPDVPAARPRPTRIRRGPMAGARVMPRRPLRGARHMPAGERHG